MSLFGAQAQIGSGLQLKLMVSDASAGLSTGPLSPTPWSRCHKRSLGVKFPCRSKTPLPRRLEPRGCG